MFRFRRNPCVTDLIRCEGISCAGGHSHLSRCCCTSPVQQHTSALPFVCSDVTVLVLDRPRHEQIIKEVREAGARIKLISDGDVGGAIEVAKLGAPVDVLFGIGGTPEGPKQNHKDFSCIWCQVMCCLLCAAFLWLNA